MRLSAKVLISLSILAVLLGLIGYGNYVWCMAKLHTKRSAVGPGKFIFEISGQFRKVTNETELSGFFMAKSGDIIELQSGESLYYIGKSDLWSRVRMSLEGSGAITAVK